jgi:hypothetical protein
MATIDEYVAVHGKTPPEGKTAATEFGDGGCYAIFAKSYVIGRWTDYEVASNALVKLQKLGGRDEYALEPSHHWDAGLAGNTKCSKCGVRRAEVVTWA